MPHPKLTSNHHFSNAAESVRRVRLLFETRTRRLRSGLKQVMNISWFGVSSLLLLGACGQTSESPPAVSIPPAASVMSEKNVEVSASAGAEKAAEGFELSLGEFDLAVRAGPLLDDGSEPRQESRGRLSLRSYSATNPPRERNPYRLYGWTDVDFIKLRAPIDKSDTPGSSEDPENPGVIVYFTPPELRNNSRPRGSPTLLIGTLAKKTATRGWRDGGGIGLFVHSKDGQCLKGELSEYGLSFVYRGSFTLCPLGGSR